MMMKTISIRVPFDFDRILRIEAARRDLNRSMFIRNALAEKLVSIHQELQTANKDTERCQNPPQVSGGAGKNCTAKE